MSWTGPITPGVMVEDVRLEKRPMQYLYREGDSVVFMDTETYDQEHIPVDAIGDALQFLKEEDIVQIAMYEGRGGDRRAARDRGAQGDLRRTGRCAATRPPT